MSNNTVNPNISEIQTKNGSVYDVAAKRFSGNRNIKFEGDVTAQESGWDGSGEMKVTTTISEGAVGESKIADEAVTNAKVADGAINWDKIATSVKNGTIAGNYNEKLATCAQVKTYVDEAITGHGSYLGQKTVAQVNALTGMNNGDHVSVSDSGSITNPDGSSTSVNAGDNVIYDGTLRKWDCLAGDYKVKQDSKEVSNESNIKTVDKVTQNENGEVSVTFKEIGKVASATAADKAGKVSVSAAQDSTWHNIAVVEGSGDKAVEEQADLTAYHTTTDGTIIRIGNMSGSGTTSKGQLSIAGQSANAETRIQSLATAQRLVSFPDKAGTILLNSDVVDTYSATGTQPVNGTAVASAIRDKANSSDVYTKTEVNNYLDGKLSITEITVSSERSVDLKSYTTEGIYTFTLNNPNGFVDAPNVPYSQHVMSGNNAVLMVFSVRGRTHQLFQYSNADGTPYWFERSIYGSSTRDWKHILNDSDITSVYSSTSEQPISGKGVADALTPIEERISEIDDGSEYGVTIGTRTYKSVKIGNRLWLAENLDEELGTLGTNEWYYNGRSDETAICKKDVSQMVTQGSDISTAYTFGEISPISSYCNCSGTIVFATAQNEETRVNVRLNSKNYATYKNAVIVVPANTTTFNFDVTINIGSDFTPWNLQFLIQNKSIQQFGSIQIKNYRLSFGQSDCGYDAITWEQALANEETAKANNYGRLYTWNNVNANISKLGLSGWRVINKKDAQFLASLETDGNNLRLNKLGGKDSYGLGFGGAGYYNNGFFQGNNQAFRCWTSETSSSGSAWQFGSDIPPATVEAASVYTGRSVRLVLDLNPDGSIPDNAKSSTKVTKQNALVDVSYDATNHKLVQTNSKGVNKDIVGASELWAGKDGAGNTITSKYVTVDTTQTISGSKTFSHPVNIVQTIGTSGSSAFGIDCGNGKVELSSNANGKRGIYLYSHGTDTSGKWAIEADENNNVTLNGNAATATKATQDASGNVITSTYATKTEVGNKSELESKLLTSADNLDSLDTLSGTTFAQYRWIGASRPANSPDTNDSVMLQIGPQNRKYQFIYPREVSESYYYWERQCIVTGWTSWKKVYYSPRKSNDVASFTTDDTQAYTGKAIATYVNSVTQELTEFDIDALWNEVVEAAAQSEEG